VVEIGRVPRGEMSCAPRDASNLGTVIQVYMRAHGLTTHSEMAAVLGFDRTLVYKYVRCARR